SRGLETGRDAWVYNHSRAALDANLARFLDTYDEERESFRAHAEQQHLTKPKGADTIGVITTDDTRIKWTSGLRDRLAKNRPVDRSGAKILASLYRPFDVQHVDITDGLIHRPAVARRYFPTAKHDNYGFYVNGIAAGNPFACLATRSVPCLDLFGKGGQFFPRLMRESYGSEVTKHDLFFFLYGPLHSPEYRERYAGELKQMLPRVPEVPVAAFRAFTSAGRELFGLHADYEDAEPYPLEVVGGEQPPMGGEEDYYRVQKMRFLSGFKAADTPESLVMNANLTVTGLQEAAYRYQ